MEIIQTKVHHLYESKPVKVSVMSFNISYIIYSIKFENGTVRNVREYLNSIQDKMIFFELINNLPLWKLSFRINQIQIIFLKK